MGITDDPNDPCIREVDEESGMQACYLVLSEEERAKGYVRPLRISYVHIRCGTVTTMSKALAETYAVEPGFYGASFCVACRTHYPVGEDGEFLWVGTDIKVGT